MLRLPLTQLIEETGYLSNTSPTVTMRLFSEKLSGDLKIPEPQGCGREDYTGRVLRNRKGEPQKYIWNQITNFIALVVSPSPVLVHMCPATPPLVSVPDLFSWERNK